MSLVTVELGVTLCINEETRAFLKPLIKIEGIDTEKDVDAQLKEGVQVAVKAIEAIDVGMQEVIADAIIQLDSGNATALSDTITKHDADIAKMKKLVVYTKAKLEELTDEVKALVVPEEGS